MKLHYFKILLFFILLSILVTLYQVHNKNEPSITTHHTPTTTSRVLSESDTQSSNYDNNPQMKSVMQQFVDRTSQRLREYDERMREKRQKRKEERDKNIQEIIEKDKMDKSLADKVEKGCLKCGCGLGGGVLPVWGLVSGLWYATLSQYATKMAIEKGIAEGLKIGLDKVTEIASPSFTGHGGATMPTMQELKTLTTGISGDNLTLYDIFQCINNNIEGLGKASENPIFSKTVKTMVEKGLMQFNSERQQEAAAVKDAFEKAKAAEFAAKTGLLSNTIIASVIAIVVIVLVMVIIYLILRYRRKKKMKKKTQYTKILNE
ncbi:rifin PIR protein,putative [Plasmodium sp. DRC-Itaito]|nr:rifin PIR protein,putative [Plasmodium sp. DRC-Itaito]